MIDVRHIFIELLRQVGRKFYFRVKRIQKYFQLYHIIYGNITYQNKRQFFYGFTYLNKRRYLHSMSLYWGVYCRYPLPLPSPVPSYLVALFGQGRRDLTPMIV